jgi:hypothetical protein
VDILGNGFRLGVASVLLVLVVAALGITWMIFEVIKYTGAFPKSGAEEAPPG